MKIQVSAFLTHKLSETLDDCFDRYAISDDNTRFIVADGVSNSFFPGIWAELLCQAFIDYPEAEYALADLKFNEFINNYRRQWRSRVMTIANSPTAKYYTVRLFREGQTAACAFSGFQLKAGKGRFAIETLSLGDCCTFVFTENLGRYERNFSSVAPDYSFNNYPDYIDSKLDTQVGEMSVLNFELPDSGLIVVTSDALAKWVFMYHGEEFFAEMCALETQVDFIKFINKFRQSDEHILENDDVVLLKIAFSEATSPDLEVNRGELFEVNDHLSPMLTITDVAEISVQQEQYSENKLQDVETIQTFVSPDLTTESTENKPLLIDSQPHQSQRTMNKSSLELPLNPEIEELDTRVLLKLIDNSKLLEIYRQVAIDKRKSLFHRVKELVANDELDDVEKIELLKIILNINS